MSFSLVGEMVRLVLADEDKLSSCLQFSELLSRKIDEGFDGVPPLLLVIAAGMVFCRLAHRLGVAQSVVHELVEHAMKGLAAGAEARKKGAN